MVRINELYITLGGHHEDEGREVSTGGRAETIVLVLISPIDDDSDMAMLPVPSFIALKRKPTNQTVSTPNKRQKVKTSSGWFVVDEQ